MRFRNHVLLITAVLGLLAAGHSARAEVSEEPVVRVAAATSLLECALRDLLGNDLDADIVCIIPPGNCPGHFDISPRTATRLRKADLLLAHDYQGALARKLHRLGDEKLDLQKIKTPGSFNIPRNYLHLLEQVKTILQKRYPNLEPRLTRNLANARLTAAKLTAKMKQLKPRWQGEPAIIAAHQKQFAAYLGLNPVGILKRPSDMRPKDLRKLLNLSPALIVGNRQSNGEAATRLADRMKVPVVVLTNFPEKQDGGVNYSNMVIKNLKALDEAWNRR